MKRTTLATSILAALLGSVASAQVTTDPVGFVSVTALGNSDTRFAVPLHRAAEFQGAVASLTSDTITISGTPNLTANQFVYASPTQPNTYYLEFQTGVLEGFRFEVVSNAAATITLNVATRALTGVVAGDQFSVIPHWTFGTMFPGQTGITTTTSISGVGNATKVLVPDTSSAGINLVASGTYFYYSGTASGGPGWRRSGGGLTTVRNNDVIIPDGYLVIRQDGVATSTTLSGVGAVPMAKRVHIIGTKTANVAQDNFVELDIPVPTSLAGSGLFESGAFIGSTTVSGTTGDKLMIYDDTVALRNKVPSKTYYYYTGAASGGPGWRLQGGGLTTIRNNEVALNPGDGVLIRKAAVTSPQSFVWAPLPTYLAP